MEYSQHLSKSWKALVIVPLGILYPLMKVQYQMDVNLRYLNDETNIAETSYLDFLFRFLLRPTVENPKCELVASITGLDMAKFLQLSMEDLKTNWNVLNVVNNHLVEDGYKNLIEIGRCSLHTIHGAFQTGATKTGWELKKVLKVMYKIFNESPARRNVYLKVGSIKFLMKFCEARLIEDKEVAERD